ncbi:hypothetical protein [Planctomicrobium sp. SH664]|uniref:hypothetical protein n=1 Tax=Planctomicrobium sp. SH664 TaxID=3448125 RepID=UPI003F5B7795
MSHAVPESQLQWQRLIREKREAGASFEQAVRAVEREHPGLRQQMLADANPKD